MVVSLQYARGVLAVTCRIIWQMIKDKLVLPYLDLKV